MSIYLFRLARFVVRRRRIVVPGWLVAVVGIVVLATASGGKTTDTFTISGTEARRAADVLSAKLPAFSGG